jgi:hypothetical protein
LVPGIPGCQRPQREADRRGIDRDRRGTFTGTHTGVFSTPTGDIPPTGRKVEGPYVNIFDLEGDKVVRNRLTFDRLDLLEKLGLAPVPAMAASR